MSVRFYDGRTAHPHEAEASLDGDMLTIRADGREIGWRLPDLTVQIEADQARVSSRREPDARLVLPVGDWNPLIGDRLADRLKSRRRSEVWLVGGLTAAAAGVVAFVFIGVPALAGPLARATPADMELRLGSNLDAQVSAAFPRCDDPRGQAILNDLGDRIATRADTPFDIRVRAVEAPMANALALPGGPILITDDLIRDARTPDELAAVISHEVAHIEKRHVMQAVWRDLGIGMLLDLVVGGGTGAGQQAVILAGQASDLSYSRDAELEADAGGQALLHAAGLSSRGMAPFFERMARAEGDAGQLGAAAEFMNTHPDSRRRGQAARAAERPGESALSAADWETVKATCSAGSDSPVERLKRRLRLGDDPALTDQGDQVGPDREGRGRP
ncbi:M48 family metallopeptidase [Brevundimonas sp.]|uniref:M48 family metallopeptidase n=1 Tax=Brevundimonas sp. TaxID=1871086 RepID=UPI002D5C4C23|nr:M48 family metallopeptidase [Brevundimonas sp.]HYC96936.1 M48 family metallopeptidase [Brevundimonas sp.]